MIQCQNCGQAGTSGSNFCRFCGARIVLRERVNQQPSGAEAAPPRPYMWKTDEFQVTDMPPRRPQQINQVQPLQNFRQPSLPAPVAPPFAYAPPAPYAAHCPRCGNQGIPRFTKKISPAGWIVFAALMVVFFPLFWIGLLIKEDIKVCGFCSYRLG